MRGTPLEAPTSRLISLYFRFKALRTLSFHR